jgi:hypothetical protein
MVILILLGHPRAMCSMAVAQLLDERFQPKRDQQADGDGLLMNHELFD